ncbi:translation initiation factor IF-3, partial [Pseudoalteromonas sp. S1610]
FNRIKSDLEELAVVESFPNSVEVRQKVMMMAPVAKK